jgi:hypothetical protein
VDQAELVLVALVVVRAAEREEQEMELMAMFPEAVALVEILRAQRRGTVLADDMMLLIHRRMK